MHRKPIRDLNQIVKKPRRLLGEATSTLWGHELCWDMNGNCTIFQCNKCHGEDCYQSTETSCDHCNLRKPLCYIRATWGLCDYDLSPRAHESLEWPIKCYTNPYNDCMTDIVDLCRILCSRKSFNDDQSTKIWACL